VENQQQNTSEPIGAPMPMGMSSGKKAATRQCPICQEVYPSKGTHIKKHHPEYKFCQKVGFPGLFFCDYCLIGKFGSLNDVLVHIRDNHKEGMAAYLKTIPPIKPDVPLRKHKESTMGKVEFVLAKIFLETERTNLLLENAPWNKEKVDGTTEKSPG